MAYSLQELQDMITVRIGDYKTAKGKKKLITRDLGSCVGIAMWDSQTGIGGLLHIMLPQYDPSEHTRTLELAKYADTGIDELVKALVSQGAKRTRLNAKLAGAAHMFKIASVPESRDISSQNLAAVQKKLSELDIPVVASEVGGYTARTMVFEPESGMLIITEPGKVRKVV